MRRLTGGDGQVLADLAAESAAADKQGRERSATAVAAQDQPGGMAEGSSAGSQGAEAVGGSSAGESVAEAFAAKLRTVAADRSQKLDGVVGAGVGEVSGASGGEVDLAKVRMEAMDKLKKQIAE